MLNEGDKYDDPIFVNAEILSHFKKKKKRLIIFGC